jgi:hypothetical protein
MRRAPEYAIGFVFAISLFRQLVRRAPECAFGFVLHIRIVPGHSGAKWGICGLLNGG